MATLGGLFQTQPPCKRNFLLENIRGVHQQRQRKTSGTNSHKMRVQDVHQKPNQPLTKQHSHLHQSKNSKASSNKVLSAPVVSPKKHSSATHTDSQQDNKLQPCCKEGCSQTTCKQGSVRQSSSDKIKISYCPKEDIVLWSGRDEYINDENVPFRWTHVCPSVISHSLCHQGVQTLDQEELNSLLEEGIIKYPSVDKLSDNRDEQVQNKKLSTPLLEWPICAEDEKSLPSDSASKTVDKTASVSTLGSSNLNSAKVNASASSAERKSIISERKSINSESSNRSPLPYLCDDLVLSVPSPSPPVSDDSVSHVGVKTDGCVLVKDKEVPSDSLSVKGYRQASTTTKYQRGVVPKYLVKRINEQRVMPKNAEVNEVNTAEKDKKTALVEARKEYDSLVSELNQMPVKTDTLRNRKRKIELEKQLDILERRILALTRISDS